MSVSVHWRRTEKRRSLESMANTMCSKEALALLLASISWIVLSEMAMPVTIPSPEPSPSTTRAYSGHREISWKVATECLQGP